MSRCCLFTLPLLIAICAVTQAARADRPNIVLIMTDDQGIGDFSFMSNPVLQTPNIDRLAAGGVHMTRFYVSPVCAPTRASLMTGRYNYRTRVTDTFVGRAMMDPGEVTVAEVLRDNGYATGIFGKWHLGDCYPMRAMDQGFTESFVHRGGGIAQPGDPPGGEGKYTDPILFRNGKPVQTSGYCTDIYFSAAMDWMENSHRSGKPFFAYIPTNAPHGPFHDVPIELYEKFKAMDLTPLVKNDLSPERMKEECDTLARIMAMIANIDDNVGRLCHRLSENGLLSNTIIIFLNDNGPNTLRYVGNLRGMKGGVHEGGIRTPLIAHWPAQLQPGRTCDTAAAHIDVMPTLLDACGVDLPGDVNLDGRSMLPLWTGQSADWPDRMLFIQAHRGDTPQRYHHFAAVGPRYKYLHASGFGLESFEGEAVCELYDLQADPGERQNLVQVVPQMVDDLKCAYDAWFDDVGSTRPDNYMPPAIIIGTQHEPSTTLTRQDWRHREGRPWAPDSSGRWFLRIHREADYRVEVRFPAIESEGEVTIRFDDGGAGIDHLTYTTAVKQGATSATFEQVHLAPSHDNGGLWFDTRVAVGGTSKGAWQVDIAPQH